ncbi:hypothetical protein Tco_1329777 [Tanacetum coccineum]
MASHASSPLNSLRFPSAAKSRSIQTASHEILTPSLHSVKDSSSLRRVKLQSCPVSSQIEPKSRVFPPNAIQYQDTTDSGKKKEKKASLFYQMETEEVSEWYITPCFVSGLHAYDGETNLEYEKNMISNEFAVMLCLDYEEKVEKKLTKGLVDFGNKILTIYPDLTTFDDESDDELEAILSSVMLLDGEFEVEKEIMGEDLIKGYKAIREKNDQRRPSQAINNKKITMLDHSKAEPIGRLLDVLYQVGVTTILASFLILDIPVDRDVPIIVGRSFLHTCGVNINTIKGTTTTFDGVCHQKFYVVKVRNAHGESDNDDNEEYCLKRNEIGKAYTAGTHGDEAGSSSRPKRTHVTKIVKEATLGRVHHEFLLWGTVIGHLRADMSEIKVYEMGGDQELFISKAWRRAFDINEPIYAELCGRTHSLTVLEFARHLGLYTNDEIHDDGFETYFLRGLRNDDHFNANKYWLSISSEEELILSRSLDKTIRNLLDVITLRELIGSNGRLIPDDPQLGVPRGAMPRPLCPTIQDLYGRMGCMEI